MSAEIDLSPRKRAFVAALAGGRSRTQAAKAVGISPRTARRYLADPLVVAALAEAQAETLGDVARRLNAGALMALDVLEAVMADAALSPNVRVRAALGWLAEAWQAREMLDFEARLSRLEAALESWRAVGEA